MNDGKVIIKAELDTKSFETQIAETEKYLQKLEQTYSKAMQGKSGLKQNEQAMANLKLEIEKTTNKLVGLRQQQEKLNSQGMSNVQASLAGIGNSMENIIGKVVRWGLAIFGIRTAYMLVRNAMATITSEDEQLKADIDYMKNVLAYALEPVVRAIVNLMKQLMFYVGYIAKAWFGVDIYAKASAKSMASGVKSAKATTKELNKQLAKFDEMNVLQKQSSGGGDDSGGGGATPSFDLSKMDMPVPKWLQWIADHKDEILAFLAGVGTALLLIKLGIDAIKATGIGLFVAGIVYAIENILKYLDDPKWETFGKIILGIGVAITGLAIAISSLPLAIAGVAIAILGIVITYWDKIKDFLVDKINWLTEKSDWIKEHLGETAGKIYDNIIMVLKKIVEDLDVKFKSIKGMFDGLIEFITGVFSGNWKKAWDGIKKIFENWWTGFKSFMSTMFAIISAMVVNMALNIGASIGDAIKGVVNYVLSSIENRVNEAISMINGAIKIINKIPGVDIGRVGKLSLPRLAQGGIVNNPGPGVMMGNYIAGERGAEAVLPLTDDTLQRLANMIPITVNLTNTMNGRVISRELQKVQNENNFAFNR